MEADLAAMLGAKVDLRTPQELSCQFRDRALRTAEVQYVR
jgi:predicted nucleotidyltransferase